MQYIHFTDNFDGSGTQVLHILQMGVLVRESLFEASLHNINKVSHKRTKNNQILKTEIFNYYIDTKKYLYPGLTYSVTPVMFDDGLV